MNVAVSADSPLGRYLAELDGDSSVPSLAGELASPHALKPVDNPQPRSKPNDERNNRSIGTRWWIRFLETANYVATERLLAKVSTSGLYDDIWETVLEMAPLGETIPTPVRWWTPEAVASIGGVGAATIAFMCIVFVSEALIPRFGAEKAIISSLMWMGRRALLLFSVVLIAVEGAYQSVLLHYSFVASRFLEDQRLYSIALTDFRKAFQHGLDVVKRSELAARGYRLGRILPPLGRLEEASSARDPAFELQCRRLRTCLRDINESMEEISRAAASRSVFNLEQANTSATGWTAMGMTVSSYEREECAAPSLLTTALAKRHELNSLQLHAALRNTLVEDLAALMFTRSGDRQKSFLSSILAQAEAYRILTRITNAWTADLSRWNAKHRHYMVVKDETGSGTKMSGSALPGDVAAISRALVDLQTACETLSVLAKSSQHDIEDDFLHDLTASNEDSTKEEPSTRLKQRLNRSRDQMGKLMQQLMSDWGRLDQAIQQVNLADDFRHTSDASDSVVDRPALHEHDQQPRSEMQQLQQHDSERDCLLVFTATSTGEREFDLQSLLREQQRFRRDGANSTPVPSFMGELQAVLERRQALPSAPTLEKRIVDEVATRISQAVSATIPLHPPPQAADLQKLLQSRFAAQLAEVSFGGDEESEVEDEKEETSTIGQH